MRRTGIPSLERLRLSRLGFQAMCGSLNRTKMVHWLNASQLEKSKMIAVRRTSLDHQNTIMSATVKKVKSRNTIQSQKEKFFNAHKYWQYKL